jgi:hypothetical protein
MSDSISVIVSQNSARGALKSLKEQIDTTQCAKTDQLQYNLDQLTSFIGQAGGARRKTGRKGRKSRKGRKTQRKTRGRK